MADIQNILSDPKFQKISSDAKKIVLGNYDDKFKSLSPEAQNIALDRILSGRTTLQGNPRQANFVGALETAGTLASGAIAEPIAGIGGLAKTITSGLEAGTETIKQIREGLTYKPQTEQGKKALEDFGEFASPVTDFLQNLETDTSDYYYDLTGSPTIAAAASTMPTVLMEVLGAGTVKGPLKGGKNALSKLKKMRSKGKIARSIKESTPTIDMLKDTARGIYKEIDDAGAIVNPIKYESLVDDITTDVLKKGLNKKLTPKAYEALNEIYSKIDKKVTTSDVDQLRQIASNAIDPSNPADSMLSRLIIEKIDDFMDSSGANLLSKSGDIDNIGKKYKIARDLWGRARRSEILQDAFEKARNQASGFENGIRTQFRSILNNKKQRKFFTESELDEIKKVVRGTKGSNLAKLVGKLGFSEGTSVGLIGGSIGAGFGAYIGGPVGAVTVPLIGQVSKKLAKRLTNGQAEFADQVIRAGNNANKITRAYIKNTPTKLRDPAELAQLLMKQDIDLSRTTLHPFTKKAMEIALDNRTAIGGGIAGTEVIKANNER